MSAYKPVLDRENPKADADRIFRDKIDLLNELLDFGTNLVPRLYQDSPKDIKAICVIFSLYRQLLMHVDAVAILARSGQAESATLQLRSVLEIAHTIEWIFDSDGENKSNHLFVANLRERLHINNIAMPGSKEAADRPKDAACLSSTQKAISTKENTSIQTTLSKPEFSQIDSEFEKSYKKQGFDQPWAKVYGKYSVRRIADELGRRREYDVLYSVYSGVMHGSDIWNSVSFEDGQIEMDPIRSIKQLQTVLRLACALTLRTIRILIESYRPGEIDNFHRIRTERWQERLQSQVEIEYHPTQQEI